MLFQAKHNALGAQYYTNQVSSCPVDPLKRPRRVVDTHHVNTLQPQQVYGEDSYKFPVLACTTISVIRIIFCGCLMSYTAVLLLQLLLLLSLLLYCIPCVNCHQWRPSRTRSQLLQPA
jgi:hypothetical protein